MPATLNLALPSLLVSALNIILSGFSQTYVVILGIYYKLQTFLYLPANGIIQGIRPLVGYNYGAGEHRRVSRIYTTSLALIAGIMVLGTALGFLICSATVRHLRQRVRTLRRQTKTGPPKKMGVMDKVLIFEAVILIAYTVADLAVFWHTGAEPYTLTGCVFGVCGLENGVMGWIKTNKDKAAEAARTSGNGQKAAQEEPPTEREEPSDVGI